MALFKATIPLYIYPYFLSQIHDATSQFRHKVDDGTSINEDR
jgi:hypothetical protein